MPLRTQLQYKLVVRQQNTNLSSLLQPFGLFATFPYINNASSMIYYSYTNKARPLSTPPHFVPRAWGERKSKGDIPECEREMG